MTCLLLYVYQDGCIQRLIQIDLQLHAGRTIVGRGAESQDGGVGQLQAAETDLAVGRGFTHGDGRVAVGLNTAVGASSRYGVDQRRGDGRQVDQRIVDLGLGFAHVVRTEAGSKSASEGIEVHRLTFLVAPDIFHEFRVVDVGVAVALNRRYLVGTAQALSR